ncbi:MAG: glycoside hydrolase family 3 C-terminal domain-containing protein, partial [Bacteroidales bacterium]|nr:glycoside hydrolase family 3 C-terminal domain-containing protein [Bacteroidales bacterium]
MQINKSLLVSLFLLIALSFNAGSQYNLGDNPVIEAKVDSILDLMTLDEKIGQMTQAERNALSSLNDIATYSLGSLLSGGGSAPTPNTGSSWASMYDNYQSYALQSRLKIPLIYGIDAVHGHSNVQGAVLFPHNIGLGCVQDIQLIEEAYYATAQEVRGTGMNWVFSPCIAVARDERWGRTYESYGETEIEAVKYGAAAVRGLQGEDMSAPDRVVACAKHFIGDGGTTNGTDQGNTQIDEAELRRLHLPGYQAAIAENVGTIMASYNSWNGIKCHGSQFLLTTLLKEELGFNGFVISDWAGIDQITGNYKDAIEASINAGIDMVMVPNNYKDFITYLTELVNESKVSQARIDDAVKRILRIKLQSGLFENPYTNTLYTSEIGSTANRNLARQCVQKSQVLLKNKGLILPLSKSDNIVIAGANSNNLGHQCGGWSISWQGGSGNITTGTTVLEGFQNLATGNITVSQDGTNIGDATVGVVVIGESPYAEGAGDNSTLALSEEDINAVTNIYNRGIPVVVLLISGRPLILEPIIDMCDAFIAAWLPGTEGQGIADLIYGDVMPSGLLSNTWPRSIRQVPINSGDADYDPLYEYGTGITNWVNETTGRNPIFMAAKTNNDGSIVEVTFNKPMGDPSLNALAFEITTTTGNIIPSSAQLKSEDPSTIVLNLPSAIQASENNLTISYTQGDLNDEENIALLSFSGKPVFNYVVGAAPILLMASTNDKGTEIILEFNKTMEDPSAEVASFNVQRNTQNSMITSAALATNSDNIIILAMSDTYVSEDELSLGYTKGAVASADGGKLNSFSDVLIINNAPGASPILSSAITNKTGTVIEAVFNKLMDDPSSEYQNFDIKINTVSATIVSADLRIAVSPEVLLTISETIVEGDMVTIDYTPGTLQSLDGGVLASFSDHSVTVNLGDYLTIPARIEAEDFTDMQGLQTEDCSDTGGGINIGYINTGDWWTYDVYAPESKDYQLDFRNAAMNTDGNFDISIDGEVVGQTQLLATGGWQSWQTTSTSIFLEQGLQTLRFTANTSDFNINWIEINEILSSKQQLLADYETTELNFTGSNTSTFNKVANPSQTGLNLSATVGKSTRGAETAANIVS